MSAAFKKKRNIKNLQLEDSPLTTPRPALNDADVTDSFAAASSSNARSSGVTVATTPGGSSSVVTLHSHQAGQPGAGGDGYHSKLSEQLANLEMGAQHKFDFDLQSNDDLTFLSELGAGNGGTVTKVLHQKSGTIMAKKVVFIDAKPSVRKQILRELQILHHCDSPYIVDFYGAYLSEPHICMCMEYMEKLSLDTIYKRWGPIRPEICGKVVVVVVNGLTYLYDVHRIIHRDVKPSNVLVSGKGQIKLCDFGVSGELINSITDTFVGTSTYMSPERIQGEQYSVKSDVWSLGITVIELALGRFPFAGGDEDDEDGDGSGDVPDELTGTLSPTKPTPHAAIEQAKEKARKRRSKGGVSLEGSSQQLSILDLLQHIVNEPAPRLPDGRGFSEGMHAFVDKCLIKEPDERPSPKELLSDPWVVESDQAKVDLLAWAESLT
ncbi:MAP kinase kinase (MEK) [Tilletia horrida]|uniref:MAP kinase kinase (MEK) n=1 Tax=Tilletia horrida TaxID=155126 RepID=A0AAN6GJD8_9BASI|nr:MAP kinase kinase (MEK) [Tilletia horrida]KAK0559104.1 MAP kinase kinase (MEK) [Tilletia horrida]